ncbi:uncharacterized protein Z519_11208 [Cladophialophora bantiana CBS 173.52]|uniref:Uncharacterized protein n=1 Tax=Cladophialophora bantiana (strain ATCC 10958 / CBS 173.52 / CDC B-1940 / NIH 8579) TaxID=1442370 RepID=A0A0D2H4A2_CLAB1|nr:uncharacterized protein Z519_11208 [Cladophialophora bantiana CBS 173.52]KIW88098.1 hypothetical protein Z519_11208 [Cladophialophora bantiana CBS 173.52]
MTYTLQSEAQKIFDKIVSDPRLNSPDGVKEFASKMKFIGDETQPFYPTPWKCAESQAALLVYIGIFAAATSKERYGLDQDIEVDVSRALLTGLAQCFIWCNDKWDSLAPEMDAVTRRWDHGYTRELYRQLATNIYRTKDGRWY